MIVDFHTHIFPLLFRRERERYFPGEPGFASLYGSAKSRLAGREDLLRQMDEEGVQRSVVFGFPWNSEELYRRHNDYILEAVQRHPDRLTGFCAFSPRSPGARREAERCLARGLSGVGELALYDDPVGEETIRALGEILETCRPWGAPLLLHVNEPVGHLYPGKTEMPLAWLYRFLKTYPEDPVVLAHWGGGLFFYALMKKEVQTVLRNAWFDTAASPFLYKEAVYRVAAQIIGLDRVLLGTDFPLLRAGRYLEEMSRAGLSRSDVRKVSGENAARLLGLGT